jgi:hypothetical protein
VKCFSARPPRCPTESHPSRGQQRSSTVGVCEVSLLAALPRPLVFRGHGPFGPAAFFTGDLLAALALVLLSVETEWTYHVYTTRGTVAKPWWKYMPPDASTIYK